MLDVHVPAMIQGVSQQAPELRLPTSVDMQLNCVSHPVYGVGRRTGTDHIKILPGLTNSDPIWTSWVGRDSRERYKLVFDGRAVRVFGLDGREYTVIADPGTLSYLSTTDPKADLETLSLIDSTLIVNRKQTVRMKTGVTAGVTNKAIVWVRQGNYGQTYGVTLNGTRYSHGPTSNTDPSLISTSVIAQALVTALGGAAGFTITYTAGESLFIIEKADGSAFDFEVDDSVGETVLGGCYHQSNSFAELPPYAPDGYLVKVLGNVGDSADDYWVKYAVERDDVDPGIRRGSWVETTGPGVVTEIDGATAPHLLDRLQDDAAGTNTGTPFELYFRFRQAPWGPRLVGTEETSPDPSFIGNQIQTAFVVQGRLGFLFKANAVLSGPSDIFRFFRKTVTSIRDDDPIDYVVNEIKRSDEPVINLRHAIGFAEQMLFISDRAWITLPLDQPITALNFRPRPVASFECDPDCKPISIEGSVMAAYSDGSLVGLREFFTDGPNASKQGDVRTRHVPRLMRGRPWQMSVCPAESTLFLRTTDDPQTLYAYRFTDINGERVQSAWKPMDFGAPILGFGVIESTLYLVLARPEGPTLESMEIPPYVQTETAPQPILLDRKTPLGLAQLRGHGPVPVPPQGGPGGGSGGGTIPGGPTDPPEEPGDPEAPGGENQGSGGLIENPWLQAGPTGNSGNSAPTPGGALNGTLTEDTEEPEAPPAPDSSGIRPDGETVQYLLTPPPPSPGFSFSLNGDARDRGIVVEYNAATNRSTVNMPWAPTIRTVFINAVNLMELRWYATGNPFTVEIEGDVRSVPVYAGEAFLHYIRLGQATLLNSSQTGGRVAVRGARIQVIRFQLNFASAGNFWINVVRRNKATSTRTFSPRRIGTSPRNLSRDGEARVNVWGEASESRVEIASRSHWPFWAVSAVWTVDTRSSNQQL